MEDRHSSKIKTIYIPLFGYDYRHGPSDGGEEAELIGRKDVREQLKALIKKATKWSGIYLVAGYRGMGKTSLVHTVVRDVKSEVTGWVQWRGNLGQKINKWFGGKNKRVILAPDWFGNRSSRSPLIDMELSLSQKDLKELDVIRLLAKALLKKYSDFRKPAYSARSMGRLLLGLGTLVVAGCLAHRCEFTFKLFEGSFFEKPEGNLNWLRDITDTSKAILDWVFGPLILLAGARILNSLLRRAGLINHRHILNRLTDLIRHIESETSTEMGTKSVGIPLLGVLAQRRLTPKFNAKEAESELLDILKDINRLHWICVKPRFLFVLDELDKIQTTAQGKPSSDFDSSFALGGDLMSNESRMRQEAIADILGNLKHFFNDANAKFIFIAGREMYDAALADISDRDTFVSSIFDEVLYVPSFLKDDDARETGGITGMTEKFLTRFLIPRSLHSNSMHPNLQTYSDIIRYQKLLFKENSYPNPETIFHDCVEKSLEEICILHQDPKIIKACKAYTDAKRLWGKKDDKHRESLTNFVQHAKNIPNLDKNDYEIEISKILSTLQNFITFLTYRSNGSPKKLTQLMEEFIVQSIGDKDGKTEYYIIATTNLPIGLATNGEKTLPNGPFLKFGYEDQYRIGLTSRIFRPFLIRNSRHSGAFDDKYLVSTSYVLDHILKYHNSSFNWWNLEFMPDVISINKPTQIRNLIQNLVHQLENSLLRRTTSGIFHYKFRRRNQLEIGFLSRISDSDSAAFTFSLDESYALKEHFLAKLTVATKRWEKSPKNDQGGYVTTISMYHSILGDIYFGDQLYDDAVAHYSEAIRTIRFKDLADVQPQLFLILIRERLKQALALEHQGAFDSSLAHYNSTSAIVLEYFTTHSKWRNNSILETEEILPTQSQMAQNASTKIEDLQFSLRLKGLAEFMPVMWQPLIARLHAIEKQSLTGISYRDILESEKIYDNLSRSVLMEAETEDFLNRAQYHLSVGTVLFFKNGVALIDDQFRNPRRGNAKAPHEDWLVATHQNLRKVRGNTAATSFPASGYLEYLKALSFLLIRSNALQSGTLDDFSCVSGFHTHLTKWLMDSKQAAQTLPELFNKVCLPHYDLLNAGLHVAKKLIDVSNKLGNVGTDESKALRHLLDRNFLEIYAGVLTRIGDVGICRLTEHLEADSKSGQNSNRPVNWDKLMDFFKASSTNYDYELRINRIAGCYILSARLFKLAGNHKGHAYSLRKLLILIHEAVGPSKKNFRKDLKKIAKLLLKYVLPEKMSALGAANGQSNRPQVLKAHAQLNHDADTEVEDQLRESLQTTTFNADFSEGLFVAARTLLHVGAFKQAHELYKSATHTNSSVLGMFERFQELEFKSQLNHRALNAIEIDIDQLYGTHNNHVNAPISHLLVKAFSHRLKIQRGKVHSNYPQIEKNIFDACAIKDSKIDEYDHRWIINFEGSLPSIDQAEMDKELSRYDDVVKRCQTKINGIIAEIKKIEAEYENKKVTIQSSMILEAAMNADLADLETIFKVQLTILKNNQKEAEKDREDNQSRFKAKEIEWQEKNHAHRKILLNGAADLISDSIYCLWEALRIMHVFEPSYVMRYSFMGMLNRRLGTWLVLYSGIRYLGEQEPKNKSQNPFIKMADDIKQKIEKLIGKRHKTVEDPLNFFFLAMEDYRKAMEVHTGGNAYKAFLKDNYYLEDDLGDMHSHFSAAIERGQLNAGKIQRAIQYLEKLEELSAAHQPWGFTEMLSYGENSPFHGTLRKELQK